MLLSELHFYLICVIKFIMRGSCYFDKTKKILIKVKIAAISTTVMLPAITACGDDTTTEYDIWITYPITLTEPSSSLVFERTVSPEYSLQNNEL